MKFNTSIVYTPDLIQRIYHQKEKGDDTNRQKVFRDLRTGKFDFIFDFEFDDRKIFWTCFESKKYNNIIKEADECVYFYLWDTTNDLEIVIPGHTQSDELNKKIWERTHSFHSIWVIGRYFPGLENYVDRPLKINFQSVKRMDYGPISKLNPLFKKMLTQYKTLKKPIFEKIDYPKVEKGEKRWRKIIDKRK